MKGFTLIEFILYTVILGIILAVMAGFLWNIIFGNIKETAYQEVQQNARFALTKVTQEIKKATGINSPANPGDSSSSIVLVMADNTSTTFDIVDNKLRITRGFPPVSSYLTSDQVKVTNLQFTNRSYSDTPGTVQIVININHINPDNRAEYQASVSLNSTVALLPGGAEPSSPHLTQAHYRWRYDDGGE